ncbi:hypothetical protein [Xanthomonas sacchari]|uniref:hypothetical protein n=1 Tax=Xanthomonas sacchari TaxID=56458 RepID=UPI002255A816|nr:hypothetical protein [Xanthomonas sacchari]
MSSLPTAASVGTMCISHTYTAFGDPPVTVRECLDDGRRMLVLRMWLNGAPLPALYLREGTIPAYDQAKNADGSSHTYVALVGDEAGGRLPLKIQVERDGRSALVATQVLLGTKAHSETQLGSLEYQVDTY